MFGSTRQQWALRRALGRSWDSWPIGSRWPENNQQKISHFQKTNQLRIIWLWCWLYCLVYWFPFSAFASWSASSAQRYARVSHVAGGTHKYGKTLWFQVALQLSSSLWCTRLQSTNRTTTSWKLPFSSAYMEGQVHSTNLYDLWESILCHLNNFSGGFEVPCLCCLGNLGLLWHQNCVNVWQKSIFVFQV